MVFEILRRKKHNPWPALLVTFEEFCENYIKLKGEGFEPVIRFFFAYNKEEFLKIGAQN